MRSFSLALCCLLAVLGLAPKIAAADGPLSEPTCTLTARFTAASSGAVEIVHDGQHSIRICAYNLDLNLVTTTSAQLVWGTGSTCATNLVSMSPILSIGSAVTSANYAITAGDGWGFLDENPSRGVSDLCLVITGSAVVSGAIRYGLF